MAVEIYYNVITQFAVPIMEQAGLRVCVDGVIRDQNNKNIVYLNPKYVEGTSDASIPKFKYLMCPVTDDMYMDISNNHPDAEIFSPFSSFKHAALLLLKLKPCLIPFAISKEKLNTAMDEDDYEKFDEYLDVFNRINPDGKFCIGISNHENPSNIVDIASFADDDKIKAAYGLCLQLVRALDPRAIKLKLKKDETESDAFMKMVNKNWSKIQRGLEAWKKARPTIAQTIKQEMKAGFDTDKIDLSDSVTNPNSTYDIKDFPEDYYIPNDPEPTYDEQGFMKPSMAMQNFVTHLFLPSSLRPVTDETLQVGDAVLPTQVVEEGETQPEGLVIPIDKVTSDTIDQIAPEKRSSLFRPTSNVVESKPTPQIQPMQVPQAQMGNMWMNPMGNTLGYGYMAAPTINPAMLMGGYGMPRAVSTIDELDLNDREYA